MPNPLGGAPRHDANAAVCMPLLHEQCLFVESLEKCCPHLLQSLPIDELLRDSHGGAELGVLPMLQRWAKPWNLADTWVVGWVLSSLLASGFRKVEEFTMPPLDGLVAWQVRADAGPPWCLFVTLDGWDMAHEWPAYEKHVFDTVRDALEAYRLQCVHAAKDEGRRYVRAPAKSQAHHYEWLALRLAGRFMVRQDVERVGVPLNEIARRYNVADPRHVGRVTAQLAAHLQILLPDARRKPRRT